MNVRRKDHLKRTKYFKFLLQICKRYNTVTLQIDSLSDKFDIEY